ncbi:MULTISPECIES: hypothetical protein [unclassified Rathayibacter]|nr:MULTISPECIES: hypothetical protein [unclassified Rathayibacter]
MLVLLLLLAVLAATALLLLVRAVERDGYRPAAFDPQYDSRGGDS